jgi:hypothetical protein
MFGIKERVVRLVGPVNGVANVPSLMEDWYGDNTAKCSNIDIVMFFLLLLGCLKSFFTTKNNCKNEISMFPSVEVSRLR